MTFGEGSCNTCCAYIAKLYLKDTDNHLQRKRKTLFLFSGIISLLFVIFSFNVTDKVLLRVVSVVTGVQAVFALVIVLVLKSDVTDLMLFILMGFHFSSVVINDISDIAVGSERQWTSLVLIADLLLFCDARQSFNISFIGAGCAYLLVIAFERTYQFGLLDFDWDGYEQEKRREPCNCNKMPCPRDLSQNLTAFTYQSLVFIIDFMCTSGFARGMASERGRVVASIDTANEIATSLSRFDLNQAHGLLEEADIPSDLRSAFIKLLGNLRSYQPYLPQSCLHRDDSPSECLSQRSIVTDSEQEGDTRKSSIPPAIIPFKRNFRYVEASLIIVNIHNSISVLNDSLVGFDNLIAAFVNNTFSSVMRHKGTPDIFLGDRMYANFGASLHRVRHLFLSFECASDILRIANLFLDPFQETSSEKLSINIAGATGKIACGDLGCEDYMLRFSVIGDLSQLVGVIERMGCSLEIPFLVSVEYHNQIRETCESRVVLQLVSCRGLTQTVFNVTPRLQEPDADEWMYQMAETGAGIWNEYNKIAIAVLTGNSITQQLETLLNRDGLHYEHLSNIIKIGVPTPFTIRC